MRLMYCRVCNRPLSDEQKKLAKHWLQEMCCSLACQQDEIKQRYACCSKAVPMACVCAYAFECVEHGQRHIGSHD
jgi:hypothetical protein